MLSGATDEKFPNVWVIMPEIGYWTSDLGKEKRAVWLVHCYARQNLGDMLINKLEVFSGVTALTFILSCRPTLTAWRDWNCLRLRPN